MSSFYINSAVRGYHVYESVWHATVGDQLGVARDLEIVSTHLLWRSLRITLQ